ncbi:MAG: 30S ribosomal protein S20 [Candidatus Dormibacteraceae bacterium]
MAKRTASAKKQARSGVKRTARNRGVRSEVKTMVVKARRAMAEAGGGDSDHHAITLDAMRALDRAASKGVLHGNNASRRKSRLARQLARLAVGATAPPAKGKGKKAAAAHPASGAKPAGRGSAKAPAAAASAAAASASAAPASASAAPAKAESKKKK